ncbi:hypothetical protein [Pedobacter miscanthi]|uniref:hypothetical protein n=1 Tax=Pedobacter miscanthi TaxID=2259170 RepID=UPI00292FCD99|nr:hypothetical protein [Pedobacter miscanthi]
MEKIKNLIAGLGGAIVLNILHESLKNSGKDMPHIDELGEEALQKSLAHFDSQIENKQTLYLTTLAGDLAGNAVYYSLIGGRNSLIWPKAVIFGLSAGIGAVRLPKPMGLDPKHTAGNDTKAAMTITYYLIGALVTGAILKSLKRG